MPLTTLADILIELGAVETINLDGGGPTTMVIHNKIVNRLRIKPASVQLSTQP